MAPSLVLLGSALPSSHLSTSKFGAGRSGRSPEPPGVVGPDADPSRRQSWQIAEHSHQLPGISSTLLTVCVTAVATVEGRHSGECGYSILQAKPSRLGHTIQIPWARRRAAEAARLTPSGPCPRIGWGWRTAGVFSWLLFSWHSVELGGDVATTLRGFLVKTWAPKRMLLAEKKGERIAR